MMCKVCSKDFKRLISHTSCIHKINSYDYYKDYEDFDVVKLYEDEKMSLIKISTLMKEKFNCGPTKKSISKYLKSKNIKIRKEGDLTAAFEWVKNNGGPWNKNLTKEQHPSIMKYSLSRMGKNNPIHTLSLEDIKSHLWQNTYSKKDKEKMFKRIGNTLREGYKNGTIISSPKIVSKENRKKILDGYYKWLEAR
jgi:hypothetical protein